MTTLSHAGFVIKLCRPYRARTKGKVERFNGGKGVATALGVLAGIDARIAIFSAVIWLMIAYTSRYSSAAALSAAIAAPFAGLLFLGPTFAVGVLAVIAAVLIWRHKANIARLRAGTEGKIGGNKGKDKQGEA